MDKIINRIYSNIKRNQSLSNDVLKIYNHSPEIKEPILVDSYNNSLIDVVKDMASDFDTVCVCVKATDYTNHKLPGKDLEQILVSLLEEANGDIEKAKRGIVIMNGIDSLYVQNVVGVSTILKNELPTFIHGNTYRIKYYDTDIDFDTTNVTVIGKGNFSHISDEKLDYNCTTSKYLGGFQEVLRAKDLEFKSDKNNKKLVKQK